MDFDRTGLTVCSRYAYPPNRLHYCGPAKQVDLAEYVKTDITDAGLTGIISQFETLYPYLRLIAAANNIKDPFNRRVVEAYWLGNPLLGKITPRDFYTHLTETLELKRKSAKPLHLEMDQALPNHAFHVFNIFIRTGHHAAPQTLSTMDKCRISWGEIVSGPDHDAYMVRTRPLEYSHNFLALGPAVIKTVYSAGIPLKPGDRVTIHWDYVCDKISVVAARNLEYYTRQAMAYADKNHRL
jgi:hypothetical protein